MIEAGAGTIAGAFIFIAAVHEWIKLCRAVKGSDQT